MALTPITDTSSALVRARSSELNLVNCDVYIAAGNMDSETIGANLTAFQDDFLDEHFKNIGVNPKDSPDLTVEDIVEEVDYMPRTIGQKVTGTITVKLLNADLISVLNASDVQNSELTFLFLPKNYAAGDQIAIYSGVYMTKKIAVKGNTEATPMVELAISGQFGADEDIPAIYTVPAAA